MQDKYGGPQSGPLEVRLWLRLLSCSTVLEKRLRRRLADSHGTTLPRFDVLATLDHYPEGLTMSQLSRALLVSNGNVTAIVRELEQQGLVRAKPDPADRRSSIVALTAIGNVQFAELAAAHRRWIENALAGLPRGKQRQLLDLLADLKTSIIAGGDHELRNADEGAFR